ncbi:MAG TPA: hypothetical protein VK305_00555, partial [Roseateles sp.]|nr:hypothetical protein [Roseateles sp.]
LFRERGFDGIGLNELMQAAGLTRGGPALREVFGEGVGNLVAVLQEQMPAATPPERREQALAMLSTMVGALVLARAVGDGGLSRELLDAARKNLPAGG